jgi:hypothetical protein
MQLSVAQIQKHSQTKNENFVYIHFHFSIVVKALKFRTYLLKFEILKLKCQENKFFFSFDLTWAVKKILYRLFDEKRLNP